jgi:hypothetical protein
MLQESELDIQLSPNYSEGRQGNPVRHICFHHAVGSAASAVSKFSNAASQTSAHFVVAPDKVYCTVDTDNTAWTNGNWQSNLESVTIEHEGDWRFGFTNEATINQSARLVAWLRTLYPSATPIRHRDVAQTACPGDLPVEDIWNRASLILNPPAPTPPVVAKVSVLNTTSKKIITTKATKVWDLGFTKWADAQSVQDLANGTVVDVSGLAQHVLGGTYYLTNYQPAQGIVQGINTVDCTDYVAPPVVAPPIVTPPVTPPVVTPPIVTPPAQSLKDWVIAQWNKLMDFLGSWKKG